MINKTKRVAIIGTGHVGAHCAYALALQGIVNELYLIDKNKHKLKSEIQDLRDSCLYLPHNVSVFEADFNELGGCDIIVNCAGDIRLLESHDRVTEMSFTIAQVNAFVPEIMKSGFSGIFINISNPCDIVTHKIAELSGLPKQHVFGTGTALDTARLTSALFLKTGVAPCSISAVMLGEHGASQMTPWSNVSFGGVPLNVLKQKDEKYTFNENQMKETAIGGAWVTYEGKKCTEYGISATLARLVRAVFNDEKCIIPVSAYLDGEYGQKGLYAGVPCMLGKDGIEEVFELPLTPDEAKEFALCCENIRNNMELIK